MCDANIAAYFKNTLIPANAGLDSLTRIKVISFLAGIVAAYKTQLPLEAKTDCREQFTAGRNSDIRNKMLAAFKHGQVNINGAYFDAGLNLTWRTLYDLVYSPVDRSLQHQANVLVWGVDLNRDVDIKVIVDACNYIHYEFNHELTGKVTYSYWAKLIQDGGMAQLNSVEREASIAEHLGIALGYYFDLPSSDVSSINSFWETAHRPQAALYLSAVNEYLTLDLDRAIAVAKGTWLARAQIVAGTFTPVCPMSKLVIPTNPDVPEYFKAEGWLPKIMDSAELMAKLITDVQSIQEPENADVRTVMHEQPTIPTNGFALMRNIME